MALVPVFLLVLFQFDLVGPARPAVNIHRGRSAARRPRLKDTSPRLRHTFVPTRDVRFPGLDRTCPDHLAMSPFDRDGPTARLAKKVAKETTSSTVNRRSVLAPRLSPLDLGRKLKQHVLFAEAADKLHADWQTRLRPGERQADGWLACHVLPRRERNIA